MDGYTTRFRALKTTEGNFHAAFTAANAATRRHIQTLSALCPGDRTVAEFVRAFSSRRTSLWEAWRRGLPPHLRTIVMTVRQEHHGPWLEGSPPSSFRAFVDEYRRFDKFVRGELGEVVAHASEREDVRRCGDKIVRSLDSLAEAWERFEASPAGSA